MAKGKDLDLLTLYEAMNQGILPPASMIVNGKETVDSIRKQLKLNKGAGICKLSKFCKKKSNVK